MFKILCAGLIALATTSAVGAAGLPYTTATVTAAQEALTRLGYDVGAADGKWGKAARKAMNDLRAKNGLPSADTFTGSSLELVHRLSPGATTLPHPGIVITDPVARRTFIQDNTYEDKFHSMYEPDE